ncbi:M23 family metallopeptidase [Microlunatus elymi]|uniref:M23 family metallopeptidase n=1 Tax=Microlunatus elymi TaxID=2596828 RepID=A0A516PWV6_9ACTN|nr:M23 family metallopeptidase [Microlunatus elymi]QDP95622.1 M23 family metallopeptidase [Microlunatus elymi]
MRSQQRKRVPLLKNFPTVTGARAFGTAKRTRARRAIEELEKDKRGWIRHGIAALAIAGLGLGAAGAVALTGSASELSGGSTTGVTVASSSSDAGVTAVGNRSDQTSRSVQRKSLSASQTSNTDGPLDGTVDMSARRDAQKNAKVTDTSSQNDAASKAGEQRAKALQDASKSSQKLSSKLSKEERERGQVAADNATTGANTTGSGDTGNATTAAGTDSQDLTSSSTGDGHATLPVAKGSYNIAATFGQYGSWARYHTGIDFAAPIGTPIHATGNGVITNAGIGSASSWAGNYVTIKFANGQQMLFAHMSSVSVSAGQQVTAGQLIGHVGQTGRAFGPHTHVELYPAGVTPGDVYSAINPAIWFHAHGLNP